MIAYPLTTPENGAIWGAGKNCARTEPSAGRFSFQEVDHGQGFQEGRREALLRIV